MRFEMFKLQYISFFFPFYSWMYAAASAVVGFNFNFPMLNSRSKWVCLLGICMNAFKWFNLCLFISSNVVWAQVKRKLIDARQHLISFWCFVFDLSCYCHCYFFFFSFFKLKCCLRHKERRRKKENKRKCCLVIHCRSIWKCTRAQ